jgi:hypothetical protein
MDEIRVYLNLSKSGSEGKHHVFCHRQNLDLKETYSMNIKGGLFEVDPRIR